METGIASGTEWLNYPMTDIYSYERPTIHYAVRLTFFFFLLFENKLYFLFHIVIYFIFFLLSKVVS